MVLDLLGLKVVWGIGCDFNSAHLPHVLLIGDQILQISNFNSNIVASLLQFLLKVSRITAIATEAGGDPNALLSVSLGTVN